MLRRSAAALVLSLIGASGCSDPVADPARGNLAITVGATQDKPAGTQCPSIGHDSNIGVPPPTLSTPGQRIEDGDGAQVSCTVKGGDPHNFKVYITQGNISFTMLGSVATGGVGTADILYTDVKLGTTVQNDPTKPCTVAANEYSLQVEKGHIWAKFDCPQVVSKPTAYCRANGIFIFENCDE